MAELVEIGVASLSPKNAELRKEIRELTEKLAFAEQEYENAQKQVLSLGKQAKAEAFGTMKGLRINLTFIRVESVNLRLAKISEKIAVNSEFIVALANSNAKEMLEVRFSNIKRVGIPNYIVVALEEGIAKFCESKDVPVYKRDPDEGIDSIRMNRRNHAVYGLKFHILREFLQLGYSVLLSYVDIVYLHNPFDHLYRDSDVESMTDGHDNMKAYRYNNIFDEPGMGWARYANTMRQRVGSGGLQLCRSRRSWRRASASAPWNCWGFEERKKKREKK